MSFARTTRRGRFLKERFGVNGSQKASRSFGLSAGFSAGRDMQQLLQGAKLSALCGSQKRTVQNFPPVALNRCSIKVCLPYFGTVVSVGVGLNPPLLPVRVEGSSGHGVSQ